MVHFFSLLDLQEYLLKEYAVVFIDVSYCFAQWRYLHEVCEPPIIHRNFKSANILLDDELAVHVSDCGLASLISSGSVSQVSHDPNIFKSITN